MDYIAGNHLVQTMLIGGNRGYGWSWLALSRPSPVSGYAINNMYTWTFLILASVYIFRFTAGEAKSLHSSMVRAPDRTSKFRKVDDPG